MALNILIVGDSYAPLIGGAQRDTQLLCRELVRRGHRVTVATAWHPGLLEQEVDPQAGVEVHRIKGLRSRLSWLSSVPSRHYPPPFPDPEAVWKFRKLISRVQPDLVHSYGWIGYSCATALLGQKIPLVISLRDYTQFCPIGTLLRMTPGGTELCSGPSLAKCLDCAPRYYSRRLVGTVVVSGVLGCSRLLRRKTSGLHCCSTYVAEVAARELLGGQRRRIPVHTIQSFHADTEDESPDPDLLRRLPPEPFILFVGALRVIKGLVPLLAAYRKLVPAPPLVFLGTREPDAPRDFPPPGTLVLYDVPHGTVMAAWERALFGVAPSISPEALGNVVHEAMSKGKAVIGTTPSGMRDMIVDGETGFLVPAGDVDALATAMQRLIDNSQLRERMGLAALERSQRFTARLVVPQFEALYAEVLRASSSCGR